MPEESTQSEGCIVSLENTALTNTTLLKEMDGVFAKSNNDLGCQVKYSMRLT